MNVNIERTIGELAVELPAATRVFEKFGIDYCCGGGKKLSDVCQSKNLDPAQVIQSLADAEAARDLGNGRNWQTESLTSLINHIVEKHHGFVRMELPRIDALLAKVVGKHGQNHPELMRVRPLFGAVAGELSMHMMKEERILFPFIAQMEAAAEGNGYTPTCPFGTVQNPIKMMEAEHENAGDNLKRIRETTGDYTPPADACTSYRELYRALMEFEADLHQHIHLENNILFPRAIQLEARM